MKNHKYELNLIIDSDGVDRVEIVGEKGNAEDGRNFYLKILDLIKNFQQSVLERIKKETIKDEETSIGEDEGI